MVVDIGVVHWVAWIQLDHRFVTDGGCSGLEKVLIGLRFGIHLIADMGYPGAVNRYRLTPLILAELHKQQLRVDTFHQLGARVAAWFTSQFIKQCAVTERP